MIQKIDSSANGALGGSPASSATEPSILGSPAPVMLVGSAEAAIASAMAELDRARDHEIMLGAEAQQRRLSEREHAIEDREKAARKKLAAGILGGLAKAAEGAASLVAAGGDGHGAAAGDSAEAATGTNGGLRAQRILLGAHAGLDLVGQGLAHGAARSTIGGERRDLSADAYEEAARRAESSREEAQKASNRLMNGIGEIERLRHESSTAALRG